MAKASKADIQALLKFMQGIERAVDEGKPDELIARFTRIGMTNLHVLTGFRRVIFGCDTLIDNCCDPSLTYLDYKPALKNSLPALESQRLEWSRQTFTEATPVSSLRKLEGEIKEVEVDLLAGDDPTEEYADCLMCLFDSAGRAGISVEQITEAFRLKLEKNKARTWVKNPDNSYSHVK